MARVSDGRIRDGPSPARIECNSRRRADVESGIHMWTHLLERDRWSGQPRKVGGPLRFTRAERLVLSQFTKGRACVAACILVTLIASARTTAQLPQRAVERSYIFAWAADADGADSDFLAVIDASPASPSYGAVLRTMPVGMKRTNAHHTEPQMPADGLLLANGFDAGVTFRFDLRDPLRPVLAAALAVPPPYQHAHSFLRLPDGRILATYQYQGDDHKHPGGIVAYAADGRVLGAGSAVDPESNEFIRPYGIAASPTLDLAVTTSHDMHGGGTSRAIQIWRLSDLHRLWTVLLPPGPRGDENVSAYEPRFLQDGVTAIVATRSCGLYLLDGVKSGRPVPTLVHTFDDTRGFVPVVIGRYWLEPLDTSRRLWYST